MMFFLGCHLVDLVLTIQGKPDNIIPYNRSTGADGVTALDFGYAVLEYGNGISTVKTSAREYGGYARRQLVIVGTKGTIELKPLERPYVGEVVYTGKCEYLDEGWHDVGDYSESTPADRYDGMIEAFGKYVLGEKENPYTLDYELELFKVVIKGGNALFLFVQGCGVGEDIEFTAVGCEYLQKSDSFGRLGVSA
jgi:predicted dehydrogenase